METGYSEYRYIKPQLEKIKLGLEQGLDVSQYDNPAFDWFQMEEIRLGLEAKIDVSLYARLDFDYLLMRQMRKGLVEGINLLPYYESGFSTSVLREVRKAKRDNVDLISYVIQGYEATQLAQMRAAHKNGIDIIPYVTLDTSGSQMEEIRLGLEHGIDVSCYSDKTYQWIQMKQIRLGLEHHIDITWYANHYYTSQQMREIRLGLEAGIRVVSYAKFLYSATDMRTRREWIIQNGDEHYLSDTGEPITEYEALNELNLSITEDEMHASIAIPYPEGAKTYSVEDIVTYLKSKGVKLGIQTDAIGRILQEGLYNQPIEVATGKQSQRGDAGQYQYFFRQQVDKAPKLLSDGSVDYKNIDFFENVTKDQVVAVYTPATSGIYGYRVVGDILPPIRGTELPKLHGTGFRIDEETHSYLSNMDGRIDLSENQLMITSVYTYTGDVTGSVGNLFFRGDILIQGSVGSGVTVEATGDVVIEGHVESAIIKAGRNVMIQGGVCAANRGTIIAGESITGKFFETVTLIAEKEIKTNYMLNCNAKTMGKIAVSGKKGAIVGGIVQAVYGISAYNIGNSAEIETTLEVGMNSLFAERLLGLDSQIKKVVEEIEAFQDGMHKMEKHYRKSADVIQNPLYDKIWQALVEKRKELDKLKEDQANMVQHYRKNAAMAQVRVMRSAYPRCHIKIDTVRMSVTQEAMQVVFRKEDGKVCGFGKQGGKS
ncbi:MAG: FapA family protein [Lachnospiraceae bacterium]